MGHYIPGAYASDFTAGEIDILLRERKKREASEPYICVCCGAPKSTPFYCEYCGTHYFISGGAAEPFVAHGGSGGNGSGLGGTVVYYANDKPYEVVDK